MNNEAVENGAKYISNVLFSQANVLPIMNFERDYDSSQCINAVKQTLIVEEDKNARGRELYANPCS